VTHVAGSLVSFLFMQEHLPLSRRVLCLCIAVLFGTLVWMVWAAWLTGPVISDSWQSIGPAVYARAPFDLRGLFLGDFDGFDRVWGHHWPGWAMAMSLTRPWLPFNPIVVFTIEVVLVALAACIPCNIASSTTGRWLACMVFLTALMQPEINVALSMMRPEALTALLMVLLVRELVNVEKKRFAIGIIAVCSFALPLLHVLGVIAPPALVLVVVLWCRLSPRTFMKNALFSRLVALSIGWLAGTATLAIWFLGDHSRLHQFSANMAAQRLSAHSLINSARACFFTDLSGLMILFLFLVTGFSVFVALRKGSRNRDVLLWAAMPITALVFSIVAQNPNRLHLAAVIPCALSACVSHGSVKKEFLTTWIPRLLLPIFLFNLLFQGNRLVKFVRSGAIGTRHATEQLVKKHAGEGRLYISPSLWEAAAAVGAQNVLFYTFPNVAEPGYREAAERSLFKDARPGDRLVFDVTQSEATNDYFEKKAFSHLTYVDPYALGPVIEEIQVKGLAGSRLFRVIRIDRPPFPP